MKKAERRKLLLRILFTALTLLWMLTIFLFSQQNADASDRTGGTVTAFLQRLFFPAYSDAPAEEFERFMGNLTYFVRKAAHFSEYLILGTLLSLTLGSYGISYGKRIFFSILAGVLYAAFDEFHQLFVPGRSGAVFDVLIDSTGVVFGSLIMSGLSALRENALTSKSDGNIIKEKREAVR